MTKCQGSEQCIFSRRMLFADSCPYFQMCFLQLQFFLSCATVVLPLCPSCIGLYIYLCRHPDSSNEQYCGYGWHLHRASWPLWLHHDGCASTAFWPRHTRGGPSAASRSFADHTCSQQVIGALGRPRPVASQAVTIHHPRISSLQQCALEMTKVKDTSSTAQKTEACYMTYLPTNMARYPCSC